MPHAGGVMDGSGRQRGYMQAGAHRFQNRYRVIVGIVIRYRNLHRQRIGGFAQALGHGLADQDQGLGNPAIGVQRGGAGLRYGGQSVDVEIAENRQVAHVFTDRVQLRIGHFTVRRGKDHHQVDQRGMYIQHVAGFSLFLVPRKAYRACAWPCYEAGRRYHIPMPELPEVETVRRGLAPLVAGQVIACVQLNRADLRGPFPKGMAASLAGAKITQVDRRAKYLLLHLDNNKVLVVHLGMSGSFFVSKHGREVQKHDHVSIELKNGAEIVFNDPRRFGSMDLIDASDLETYKPLKTLGPEPLSRGFTGKTLFEKLKDKRTTMKAALMDQRVVAGLGNIYVCEALYRSRIDPARMAHTITVAKANDLVVAIKAVLNDALKSGGSSLRDYVNARGEAGYFQHHFDVYGKEGEACSSCKRSKIKRIAQAGRSTFFCSKCQR